MFSGIILFGLLFRACVNPMPPVETPVPVAVLEIDTVPESDLYGIREDLYKVVEGKVRRNQTLADLLLPHGVSLQEIYHISLLPDSLIDELDDDEIYELETALLSREEHDNHRASRS